MKTKQELKEAFKQTKFPMGVYQVRNTDTGRVLISSSVNIHAAFNRTRIELNFNAHKNAALQSDWTTLGADKFSFEILAEVEEEDDKVVDYKKEVKVLEGIYREELEKQGGGNYY